MHDIHKEQRMIMYNFDTILFPWGESPDTGAVGIDRHSRYGYWERKDGSEGGGLWFEPACEAPRASADGGLIAGKPIKNGPLELVDYDGAFDLPKPVVAALRAAGFVLDEHYFGA